MVSKVRVLAALYKQLVYNTVIMVLLLPVCVARGVGITRHTGRGL